MREVPAAEGRLELGFGVDLNNNGNWAIFSVKGDGLFYARTNVDGTSTETQLPSSLIGSPHVYRIDWDATQVRYYVDGTLVATHAATFATAMRPIASDFTAGGPEVSVDWLHMSPFQASGTFDSRVFDAGSPVTWGRCPGAPIRRVGRGSRSASAPATPRHRMQAGPPSAHSARPAPRSALARATSSTGPH